MPGDMLHHDQYPQNTNKKTVLFFLFFEMIEKYLLTGEMFTINNVK